MKLTIEQLTNIIHEEVYSVIEESVMGQLPEKYIELIYKWLSIEGKANPSTLNKVVSYFQNSEKDEVASYLLKMAKKVKQNKNMPLKLTDKWIEVPKGSIMPPGAEYRMDLSAEKTYARMLGK